MTKYNVVELRSTEPEKVWVYDGFLVSTPVTTVEHLEVDHRSGR